MPTQYRKSDTFHPGLIECEPCQYLQFDGVLKGGPMEFNRWKCSHVESQGQLEITSRTPTIPMRCPLMQINFKES